jgi:hypothetical protein
MENSMEKYLEKLGLWLYERLPDKLTRNDNVRHDLGTLEPTGDISKLQKKYYAEKLSLCAVIVVIGVVFSVYLWIGNVNGTKLVDNVLNRNEYGDGSSTYSLVASDGENEYDIPLELSERVYTRQEIEALSDGILEVIDDVILGENESLDRIEYDMNFVDSISGYPFSIEYSTDYDYITKTGELVNYVLEEPVITEIEMTLTYGDYTVVHSIYANIYSKAIGPTIDEQIIEQLNNAERGNRESRELILPNIIGDTVINWSFKRSYSGLICLMATPVLMIFIFVSKDRDLHKLVEEREVQMRLDYPEIVSALALLVGAGMTVPNAWKKIAYDYRKRKEEGGEARFAYEEMLITVYEMDSGTMQSVAFERFGKRCRIPSYNKLSTLVSQNIRKGASNLPILLKEEAREAFEDRKHLARKQGEQAGTKLLGPMMLLLILTLVVILVPAFKNYF